VLASISGSITHFIGNHGIYAVFVLMILAALIPVASELVMLYAGAVAAGAFSGVHVHVFGHEVTTPFWAYLAVSVAGLLGNTIGCAIGWWIGDRGGRPLVERYGRYIHVSQARFARAERWFARFDQWAVPLGLATPLVRSFVAIPAGIFEMPFRLFIVLAAAGCAVFCFGLAGAGWALGTSYTHAHGDLRYVDYAIVAIVVLLAVYLIVRRVRASRLNRHAERTAR
jgi:membrane protein DedA with SNARE-associated domain